MKTMMLAALVAVPVVLQGASPGDAPQLPITGVRIVNVSTEPQLQNAMGNLQNGDTILLATIATNFTRLSSAFRGRPTAQPAIILPMLRFTCVTAPAPP